VAAALALGVAWWMQSGQRDWNEALDDDSDG
jgi:hypothetical protein